jgi:hypothetical protein
MIERTWETLGETAMIPSLGGIKLFIGKMINLCGNLTQISMSAKVTSKEEEFEFFKFIEDNTTFTMFLRKPWIDRDRARGKEKEFLE